MTANHITVAIPAYNEELNIGTLARSILNQRMDNFVLDRLLVISDGSTDSTVSQVQQIRDPRIKLVIHRERQGINKSLNQIFSISKSPILFIFDADIALVGRLFLSRVVDQFQVKPASKIDLASFQVIAQQSASFLSRVLAINQNFKNRMFRSISDSDNIYLCHGRARAFSRDFYRDLKIPLDCPEDAYTYLACRQAGFTFRYLPSARIKYRPPDNLRDHFSQSVRFNQGKSKLSRYFSGSDLAYQIPPGVFVGHVLAYLFDYPIYAISYILVTLVSAAVSSVIRVDQSKWDPAQSSKEVL